MGGGRRNFIPVTSADPEYPDATGSRQDGRNLTDEWLEARISADLNAEYVWKLDDFNAIDPEVTDALLGQLGSFAAGIKFKFVSILF